jgi:hypothetical protein
MKRTAPPDLTERTNAQTIDLNRVYHFSARAEREISCPAQSL